MAAVRAVASSWQEGGLRSEVGAPTCSGGCRGLWPAAGGWCISLRWLGGTRRVMHAGVCRVCTEGGGLVRVHLLPALAPSSLGCCASVSSSLRTTHVC